MRARPAGSCRERTRRRAKSALAAVEVDEHDGRDEADGERRQAQQEQRPGAQADDDQQHRDPGRQAEIARERILNPAGQSVVARDPFADLIAQPDVDGLLIGCANSNLQHFRAICNKVFSCNALPCSSGNSKELAL